MSKRLAVLVLLIVLPGCDVIESAIYRRAARQAASGPTEAVAGDDALFVVLCGTGSPMPDPTRAAACTAIVANGNLYLIDVGPGSWENVQRWRLPTARLAGVLLTHFHSDHIGDLGEAVMQSWAFGRRAPLSVYGPAGVERVVGGFREAYALDTQYRIAHHGADVMPPSGGEARAVRIDVPAGGTVPVLEHDGVTITAFRVDHAPIEPAVGYRIEYRGRSVVVSGDTKKSDVLRAAATGADLLVHEVLGAHMTNRVAAALDEEGATRLGKIMADVSDYHTTPAEAVAIGAAAGVRMLVFSHVVPPLQNRIARRMFLRGIPDPPGVSYLVGADGMLFTLPEGTNAVAQGFVGE